MTLRRLSLATMAAMVLCCGCSDDKDSGVVVTMDKWIGSSCACDGDGCAVLGIPLPAPTLKNGAALGTITGCENLGSKDGVGVDGYEGARLVCLPTISTDYQTMAPPTYFPQGYCALSAVKCEGSDAFCGMVTYGDVDAMTSCPEGSVMVTSVFDYSIMGSKVKITNKTCTKHCSTNSDCNEAGEMSCINKGGHKFCYNENNFTFLGDDITYLDF